MLTDVYIMYINRLGDSMNVIVILKPKKKHLTFEERLEMFEKLPNNKKGNVESYDWGEDLGKEIFD